MWINRGQAKMPPGRSSASAWRHLSLTSIYLISAAALAASLVDIGPVAAPRTVIAGTGEEYTAALDLALLAAGTGTPAHTADRSPGRAAAAVVVAAGNKAAGLTLSWNSYCSYQTRPAKRPWQ